MLILSGWFDYLANGQSNGTILFLNPLLPSGTFFNFLSMHGGMGRVWWRMCWHGLPSSMGCLGTFFPQGSATWFIVICSDWLSFICPKKPICTLKAPRVLWWQVLKTRHSRLNALPIFWNKIKTRSEKTKWWVREGASVLPWIMYDFC